MISQDNIEALIVTTNVKYMPEFNRNSIASSVETKNENFLLNVINNIKKHININNFLIVHDLKIDNKESLIYQEKISGFCKKEGIRLITSPSSIKIPSQISATIAFKNGINNIEKDYLLFWEHDHFFTRSVNWELIYDCFQNGGKMMRFNRKINKINKSYKIVKGIIDNFELITDSKFNKDILKTNLYTNGPFISEKKYCLNLWQNVNFKYPSWNGHFGGFIEGPVNQKMLSDEFNLSEAEFRKIYPIFLYGGHNFKPLVKHQGNYIPTYRIGSSYLVIIINLIKKIKLMIKSSINRA